jgi:hypothetical protein
VVYNRVFFCPPKGILRAQCLFWTLCFSLFSGSSWGAPPANDLIENALQLPGYVGAVTNLTAAEATSTPSDPDYSPVSPTIWFKPPATAIPTTGMVSIASSGVLSTMRVYEQTSTGYVRRALSSSTVIVTNTPGKTNLIGLYFGVSSATNHFALNYSFATLAPTSPTANMNLVAPGTAVVAFTNREPGVDFTSVNVYARMSGVATNLIGTGNSFPLQITWTNEIAGAVDFIAEGLATSGELRRSTTNRVTFKNANDNFANAIDLNANGGETTFRPNGLTREAGEPPSPSNFGSIWYRWVPARSGVAQVSLTSEAPVALFTGTSVANLVAVPRLPAVDGSTVLQAEVVAGQTYYVAAYPTGGAFQMLKYDVVALRFISPTVRSGLKAPGVIDLGVSGVPGDVETVEFHRGTNLIGVAGAPFALKWTNVLTGPLVISAIGRTPAGTGYPSEIIGLNVTAANDDFANAITLPGDLRLLEMYSSANYASYGVNETGPGIWWRWTPTSTGYCVIAPVESAVGLLVLKAATRVAEGYNQPVSFMAEAGATYDILTTHSFAPENGFHWSIQNSPMTMASGNGVHTRVSELRPNVIGDTNGLARVDYFIGEEKIATGTGPDFVGRWTPTAPGNYSVRLKVIYENGAVLDGGVANLQVGPGNDVFANALELPGEMIEQEVTLDQSTATTEAGEPFPNSTRTVWWKWTPTYTARARVRIETFGSDITYLVGTGSSISNLTILAANDYSGRGLLFNAEAGKTYYIEIGGQFNSPLVWRLTQETLAMRLLSGTKAPIRLGVTNANPNDVFERVDYYSDNVAAGAGVAPTFEFTLNELGTRVLQVVATNQNGQVRRSFPTEVEIIPGNDDFADAAEVPAASTQFAGTSTFWHSTAEANEPYQDGNSSLWWKWTPTMSGNVTIRGNIQTTDPLDIFVATGDSLTNLTEVAHVQPGTKSLEFRATAGTTYYIAFRSSKWAGPLAWSLAQETFALIVPMRAAPIALTVENTNPSESFDSAVILVNEAPIAAVSGPAWSYTWNGGAAGKYVFSAVATNQAGEKRTTRGVEYWVGPTHDYFADAIELQAGVTNTANLGGASIEPGEPRWYAEANGSLWFKWTPPIDGNYTAIFHSGGENILGRSSFYEGTAGEPLTKFRRMTPTFGARSIMSSMVAGREYYLCVTTLDRADESVSFSIQGPPTNDLLENRVMLAGAAPSFTGDLTSGGIEAKERDLFYMWSQPNYGSIWFEWTATETGDAKVIIDQGPAQVGTMAIAGTNWTSAALHYPYIEMSGAPLNATFRVVAGNTYCFGLYGDAAKVRAHISVTPVAAPVNDFRRDATLLTGSSVRVTGQLQHSTLEPGERQGTGGPAYFGGSIWYRWIASADGFLKFWLDDAAPLYTSGLHVLAVPNPNDTYDTILVTQGQEIYFQVTCAPGQVATPILNLELTPRTGTGSQNDAIADAAPIVEFPYSRTGNMFGATREAGEPIGKYADGGESSLWWSFKATQSGVFMASVNTVGWGGRLIAYRGTEIANLEYLPEYTGSEIRFAAAPGEEYRIQLLNVMNSGVAGDFTLNASFEAAPANDNFANRIALEGNGEVTTWILSPTLEAGETVVSSAVNGSLWWSYTAPSDGRFQIQPQAAVAVYTGNSVDQLTTIMTNGIPGGLFVIKATKGVTYHIQLYTAGDNSFAQGKFFYSFTPLEPTTNDNFADAAPLDGSAKSNWGATRELGEPLHSGSSGTNKSIWWKMTAGANLSSGGIRISQTTLSNVTIAVYQGTTVDTLRLLSKGPDRVLFDAWACETYYVAVETPESEDGDISITFTGRPTTASRTIPGNLVRNGSFENTAEPVWVFSDVGGAINEIAPDGRNFVTTWIGSFYQDVPTVAGEKYRLRLVYAPAAVEQDAFEVSFGGAVVGKLAWTEPGWLVGEFVVTATSDLSRLKFRGIGAGGSMDQVSLVPLNDPPAILTQPVSLTVFAGSPALFRAGITGAEPMARQWYFNGAPVAGQTDVSLKIASVTAADAGTYYIIATNAYGRVESDHVTLTVEVSSQLQIVLQPQSDVVFAGQYFALQTAAVGAPPLAYQWSRNGIDIAGATNSSLVFASFAAEQAGTYAVKISNAAESVTSLPAVVGLATGAQTGGGLVWFSNTQGFFPTEETAPVYDVDGITKLSGAGYVAQLYVGATADVLRPVGAPLPFLNRGTGAWQGRTIELPNIAPGAEAFTQVRVWELAAGASYESARALGGKFGRSEVMRITAMARLFPPPIPEGTPLPMQSFSLKAGLPNFVTGKLTLQETRDDGTMVWQLTGAAGFRYLIERQVNAGQWAPLTVVTNTTGTVTFTDQANASAQIQIYRARMID